MGLQSPIIKKLFYEKIVFKLAQFLGLNNYLTMNLTNLFRVLDADANPSESFDTQARKSNCREHSRIQGYLGVFNSTLIRYHRRFVPYITEVGCSKMLFCSPTMLLQLSFLIPHYLYLQPGRFVATK